MERYYQANPNNVDKHLTHDHHIIAGSRILAVDKLTSKASNSYLISTIKVKSFCNMYLETCYHERLHIIFI